MRLLSNTGFLQSKGIPVGLGVLCLALILIISTVNVPVASSLITRINNIIYDSFIQFHGIPSNDDVHVIIVDIDAKSVKKLGKWPWHRDITATLLEKLKQAGVVVTAFDMVMSEPDVNYALGLKEKLEKLKLPASLAALPSTLEKIAPAVDSDIALAKAIKDYDVVLGFLFDNQTAEITGVLPPSLKDSQGLPLIVNNSDIYQFSGYKGNLKLFTEAAPASGFVTNFPDSDGIVRHGLLIARYQNKLYPTLALATAMRYLLADKTTLMWEKPKVKKDLYGIKIDGTFIPTDKTGRVLIPFYGSPATLPYVSAIDVIEGKVGSEELEGSIVIIGSTMVILADLHPTPLAETFPGVEMVASITKAIVEQKMPSKYAQNQLSGYCVEILLGLLLIFTLPFLRAWLMLLLSAVVFFLFLGFSLALFILKSIYFPPASVLILIMLLAMINHTYVFIMEISERRRVKSLFGQYVPETYVQELISHPDQWTLEGQLRTMTVLFSDIRNFTAMSEGLAPTELRSFLNTILTTQTEIIQQYFGTIDKYVGDMVVAFWGAPIDDSEHPIHAVNAAVEISQRMPVLNAKLKELDLPAIEVGIGIASGPMSVGDMGSKFRRAYTVIGDNVNLASRLEALTKYYKVNILVNETVLADANNYIWRPIDKVLVKGKKKPVSIYQPLGTTESISTEQLEELDAYKKALDAYYAQNWSLAESAFTALSKTHPDIFLYQLYLERIKTLGQKTKIQNWDGVFTHEQKKYD